MGTKEPDLKPSRWLVAAVPVALRGAGARRLGPSLRLVAVMAVVLGALQTAAAVGKVRQPSPLERHRGCAADRVQA